MFRLLIFGFLILVGLSPFLGSKPAWANNFSGQLKSITDDYPYHLGPPTSDVVPYVTLEMNDKYKLSKALRIQWKLFALTNTASKSAPENFYGNVPEAFLEYKKSWSKIRLGINTLNWGVVDVSSPSDVTNTSALFHPLRSIKQGAPMAEWQIGGEALNVDLIYLPVQRAPQLPSNDSRWMPRQYLINIPGTGTVMLPNSLDYQYIPSETLNRALNNNYGAKLSSHLGNLDIQLAHFEGAAPNPKLHPTLNLTFGNSSTEAIAESPVLLSPVYYRVRTSALGFVLASDKWIFRGESAYQHTISQDPILQPWSWTNVLAVETNVDVGSSTVTLLGQFYYTKNPQAPDDFISSSYRLFDRTGLLGARWAYSDNLTLTASALYETITQGWFWTAGFDNKLTEQLRWALSWHDFSARYDGLIRTFSKDSHATLELTYFF